MRHILIIIMLLTCEAAAGQTALEDYRRSVADSYAARTEPPP